MAGDGPEGTPLLRLLRRDPGLALVILACGIVGAAVLFDMPTEMFILGGAVLIAGRLLSILRGPRGGGAG